MDRDKFDVRMAVVCVSLAAVLWLLSVLFWKRPPR